MSGVTVMVMTAVVLVSALSVVAVHAGETEGEHSDTETDISDTGMKDHSNMIDNEGGEEENTETGGDDTAQKVTTDDGATAEPSTAEAAATSDVGGEAAGGRNADPDQTTTAGYKTGATATTTAGGYNGKQEIAQASGDADTSAANYQGASVSGMVAAILVAAALI